MPYKSLSLFLLLSSGVAMAIGTIAPCDPIEENEKAKISKEFDALKKIFPERSLYLPTEMDRLHEVIGLKDFANYSRKHDLSPEQVVRLKEGGFRIVRFYPDNLTSEDRAILEKNGFQSVYAILYEGISIPESHYVLLTKKWLIGKRNNEKTFIHVIISAQDHLGLSDECHVSIDYNSTFAATLYN